MLQCELVSCVVFVPKFWTDGPFSGGLNNHVDRVSPVLPAGSTDHPSSRARATPARGPRARVVVPRQVEGARRSTDG